MENVKESKGESRKNTFNYPLLPLRDVVIFPYMIVPLFIGRSKSAEPRTWTPRACRP